MVETPSVAHEVNYAARILLFILRLGAAQRVIRGLLNGNVPEQFNLRPVRLLVIIHADDFEAPLAGRGLVAQVFAGHGKQFPAFVLVNRDSAGFTSWVVRVFTSTKHTMSSCQPIRSISPRRLGVRKLRATMVYPCLRR